MQTKIWQIRNKIAGFSRSLQMYSSGASCQTCDKRCWPEPHNSKRPSLLQGPGSGYLRLFIALLPSAEVVMRGPFVNRRQTVQTKRRTCAFQMSCAVIWYLSRRFEWKGRLSLILGFREMAMIFDWIRVVVGQKSSSSIYLHCRLLLKLKKSVSNYTRLILLFIN